MPTRVDKNRPNKATQVEVKCDCGKSNATCLYDFLTNRTLSCGCALNENFSVAANEVGSFLQSIGVDFIKSHRLGKHRELDFFVPSHNLGIEYHGCHWHSEARRSEKDKLKGYEKFLMCQKRGIELIQIYNDEWKDKRLVFEDVLRRRLLRSRGFRRLYYLQCKEIPKTEADEFLNQNHYIGSATGSIRLGLFSRNELIGVAICKVYKKTEQIECTRFAMKLGTRSYQPFRKVIEFLRKDYPKHILFSFSDNRLHTGTSYQKLGFKMGRKVRPSYCYTNGISRQHKFNFRVKAGINEKEKASESSYYHLWDSGKKRWELVL